MTIISGYPIVSSRIQKSLWLNLMKILEYWMPKIKCIINYSHTIQQKKNMIFVLRHKNIFHPDHPQAYSLQLH